MKDFAAITENSIKRMSMLKSFITEIHLMEANYYVKVTPEMKEKYAKLEENIQSIIKEEGKFIQSL